MTFIDLFGHTPTTAILDFLGDHPRFYYAPVFIKKQTVEGVTKQLLEVLRKKELIVKRRATKEDLPNHPNINSITEVYAINMNNDTVRSVLRKDLEEGKKIAEQEVKNGV